MKISQNFVAFSEYMNFNVFLFDSEMNPTELKLGGPQISILLHELF